MAAALLTLGACARRDEPRRLLVFAAASLTGAFEEIAADFETRHTDTVVELHFAGSSQLALQIEEGAPAHVFAAADAPTMERVVAAGRVRSGPHVFAHNRLTLVTRPGNPLGIEGLADLAREDVALLVCAPEVPAGRYARQAAEKAGVTLRPVSEEPNVKAVVSKIALGEADVGVVYATDAKAAGGEVGAVAIPDEHNVIASYPIAVLDTGRKNADAEAFVHFVRRVYGMVYLEAHGFTVP